MSTPDGNKPIRILSKFLYIEPISSCNLHCKMCYTNATNGSGKRLIAAEDLLNFVKRFLMITPPPVFIYWCGLGEVFLYKDLPRVVNRLLAEYGQDKVKQTIQTNGTIRRLREFDSLQSLDFRVSIDGLRQFHEWHRGKNTYDRTIEFCHEAMDLGCHSLGIRMLLTRENIESVDEFYTELQQRVGPLVELLLDVPFTNKELRGVRTKALAISQTDIIDDKAITRSEAMQILEQKYLNRYELDENTEAVDNYISLTTYGVFNCCHGIINLGDLNTDIASLLERLPATKAKCRACSLFPCM